MLIDTHCHLNFKDFKEDADEVIKKTLSENIWIINVGSQYSTSQRAINYAEKYSEGVWAAIGIHPVHLFDSNGSENKDYPKKISLEKFDYNKYLELAKHKKVVAIGEVGLDYHHFNTKNLKTEQRNGLTLNKGKAMAKEGKKINLKEYEDGFVIEGKGAVDFENYKKKIIDIITLQKEVFLKFIRLANETNKPLIIHGWNADKKDKELVGGAVAYDDILTIIQGNTVNKKGVVHSFIGGYKIAQKFIEEGFLIGLNGIITYSESYDKLIREIGLENIIIETDAPYLTPNPLEKYSRNEPLNMKLVARKISDVLKIDIVEVEKVTTNNAKKLFGI